MNNTRLQLDHSKCSTINTFCYKQEFCFSVFYIYIYLQMIVLSLLVFFRKILNSKTYNLVEDSEEDLPVWLYVTAFYLKCNLNGKLNYSVMQSHSNQINHRWRTRVTWTNVFTRHCKVLTCTNVCHPAKPDIILFTERLNPFFLPFWFIDRPVSFIVK